MSLEMKYFVLKPRAKHAHDYFAEASQRAMHAYADALEENDVDEELCRELHEWAQREQARMLHLSEPDPPPAEPDDDGAFADSGGLACPPAEVSNTARVQEPTDSEMLDWLLHNIATLLGEPLELFPATREAICAAMAKGKHT